MAFPDYPRAPGSQPPSGYPQSGEPSGYPQPGAPYPQPGAPSGYPQPGPPYPQPKPPSGYPQPGAPYPQPKPPSGYPQPQPAPPSGYPQPGPAPGYQQPGPPPGYQQPGYQQPGPPPGYQQPGYQQPGPPPGYQQPASQFPGWPAPGPPVHAPPRRDSRSKTDRRGRLVLCVLVILVAVAGLVDTGRGIARQLAPRTFTAAQRQRIIAWEVAKRWRVLPAGRIFPAAVGYRLRGTGFGSAGSLALTARRLAIARQATCPGAAGDGLAQVVAPRGCQAILRATYTDSSMSLVLTVGVAVLRNQAVARSAAAELTSGPGRSPAKALRLLLRPVPVPGTPAAAFGSRQRQLSWVAATGPYLIISTVGFADARPRVPVGKDSLADMEMISLAGGVDLAVAAPLGRPPPAPHCPGGPGC